MSAKPSPSNFRYCQTRWQTQRCALRLCSRSIQDEAARSPEPASRPFFFRTSRREPATVTERAFHPAQRQSIRNSRFRFEVPARIVRQGGECRRRRCDPTGCDFSTPNAKPGCPQPLLPVRSFPSNPQKKTRFRQLFENNTVLFHVKTGHERNLASFSKGSIEARSSPSAGPVHWPQSAASLTYFYRHLRDLQRLVKAGILLAQKGRDHCALAS